MKFISKQAEKETEEYIRQLEEIRDKNRKLIEEWKSIRWWQFWKRKPSRDEQKRIIINNYRKAGIKL